MDAKKKEAVKSFLIGFTASLLASIIVELAMLILSRI